MRFKKSVLLASSLLLGAVTTHAMAATFKVPISYQIMYVDLKDGSDYGGDFDVTIPSGHHQIVVRYYQTLRRGGDVDIVKSEPLIIDMNVKKDANLELKAPYIHQKERAEKYSKKPTFDIVNGQGDKVQYKVSMLPAQPGFQPLRNFREEIKEFTGVGAAAQKTTAANESYSAPAPAPASVTKTNEFQMLQFWFNKSDEQTRKDFQIWVLEKTHEPKVNNTEFEMLQFWYDKANKAERKAFKVWMVQ